MERILQLGLIGLTEFAAAQQYPQWRPPVGQLTQAANALGSDVCNEEAWTSVRSAIHVASITEIAAILGYLGRQYPARLPSLVAATKRNRAQRALLCAILVPDLVDMATLREFVWQYPIDWATLVSACFPNAEDPNIERYLLLRYPHRILRGRYQEWGEMALPAHLWRYVMKVV